MIILIANVITGLLLTVLSFKSLYINSPWPLNIANCIFKLLKSKRYIECHGPDGYSDFSMATAVMCFVKGKILYHWGDWWTRFFVWL